MRRTPALEFAVRATETAITAWDLAEQLASRYPQVTPERISTIVAWRDTPYFMASERAALALTEADAAGGPNRSGV
jgi:hypothetical protein